MRESMKIITICKKVNSLTDEDFAEMDRMAECQVNFIHPLKLRTQQEQSRLGHYNQAVLKKLRELREVIARCVI